jgi:Rieske Fe-S protein
MSFSPACALKTLCETKTRESLAMLGRREWVKCFALGWAAALTGGARRTLLADISPGANPANVLTIKVSDYPVLLSTFGSVRLSLFNSNLLGGKIILSRGPGDVFYAVDAVCTHQGTIVEPYDNTEFTEAINCYSHGSRYDIQGNVLTEAAPGQANLPKFNTAYADGLVRIELPGLNFKINSVTQQAATPGTTRLALNFNPRTSGVYRVRHTPDLVTPPTQVSFATRSGDPANVTQISYLNSNPRTVWVDSTSARGFYFIELVVSLEASLPLAS